MNHKILLSEDITPQEILVNPLNNSKSKFQYSFNRAERFNHNKTEMSDYKYYQLPNTRTTKTTTFGNSCRKTIYEKNSSLSPNLYIYAVDGEFSAKNNNKNKGVVFGSGRNVIVFLCRKKKSIILSPLVTPLGLADTTPIHNC